jgi:hypothetical protein
MLVEMVRLQDRLAAFMAGGAKTARTAGKSAAYGRALGEATYAQLSATCLPSRSSDLAHADNGQTNDH